MNIEEVMTRLCAAGSDAVSRYVEISDLEVRKMPEYFVPAFILHKLGMTATLESNFLDLFYWNTTIRDRRGLQRAIDESELLRMQAMEESQMWRVDMALFDDDPGKQKDQQDFLALLEFKKDYLYVSNNPGERSDRSKLLTIMKHLDTCEHGAVCGWMTEDRRDFYRANALKSGDRWFESEVHGLPHESHPYIFCAQLFDRRAS